MSNVCAVAPPPSEQTNPQAARAHPSQQCYCALTMDSAAVRGLLVASLDHNTDARRQAELNLKQVEEQAGFLDCCFNILEAEQEAQVRLASMIRPLPRPGDLPLPQTIQLTCPSSCHLHQEPRQPCVVRDRGRTIHITRGREGPRTGTPRPYPRPIRAHRPPAVDPRASANPPI